MKIPKIGFIAQLLIPVIYKLVDNSHITSDLRTTFICTSKHELQDAASISWQQDVESPKFKQPRECDGF